MVYALSQISRRNTKIMLKKLQKLRLIAAFITAPLSIFGLAVVIPIAAKSRSVTPEALKMIIAAVVVLAVIAIISLPKTK
jgi:hypothetical protein